MTISYCNFSVSFHTVLDFTFNDVSAVSESAMHHVLYNCDLDSRGLQGVCSTLLVYSQQVVESSGEGLSIMKLAVLFKVSPRPFLAQFKQTKVHSLAWTICHSAKNF